MLPDTVRLGPDFAEAQLKEAYHYPVTPQERIACLSTMFGNKSIGGVLSEISSGLVSHDVLLTDYAPELDKYYFNHYMPETFGIPIDNHRNASRSAHQRYYDVANNVARLTSRVLYPKSDIFDPARKIVLPSDSPSRLALDYLNGQMDERTAFEYFRHLTWAQIAGRFISAREHMSGRTSFDNMWRKLTDHLLQVRLGESQPIPIWSLHDNRTNAVVGLSHRPIDRARGDTHVKYHPIDMYTLHPGFQADIRFNLSPRLKDPERAVLKYEEAMVFGFPNPKEKLVTDALGAAIYVDGGSQVRDDFVDIFMEWFNLAYPNSTISEKTATDGTVGKNGDLNWRRFKITISKDDDPDIKGSQAKAEFTVSTVADYLTNEYELDSPDSDEDRQNGVTHVEKSNGRSHRLHEIRRLKALQRIHQPLELYFPDHCAAGRQEEVKTAIEAKWQIVTEAARATLLSEALWQPDIDGPLLPIY